MQDSSRTQIPNRRIPWAILNGTVLVVLAFVLLFTGYIEGGAFVSLLTLALLVGLLTLFGDRVYQVTLFGSEIRLRKIEEDASKAIDGLRQSRIDNYRISLRLGTLHGETIEETNRNGSGADILINVVHMIREAELTEVLAEDVIAGCRAVEAGLVDALVGKDAASRIEAKAFFSSSKEPTTSESILAHYDQGDFASLSSKDPAFADAVAKLRELVRLRQQAHLYR